MAFNPARLCRRRRRRRRQIFSAATAVEPGNDDDDETTVTGARAAGPPSSRAGATPGEIFMPACDSENRAVYGRASNINVIH